MSFAMSGSLKSTVPGGSWLSMAVPAVCSSCGLVFDMEPLLRHDDWYKPAGRILEELFGSSGVLCEECMGLKVRGVLEDDY